jgi:hypothetical protein
MPKILCLRNLTKLEGMSDLGRVESNLPEEVVRQDEGAQVLEAVVPPVRTDTAGGRPHRVPAHFPAQHNAPAVIVGSVADPDPNPDPRVFGPPGSGSTSPRYGSGSGSCSGSGSGSFYRHAKIVRKTLIPPIL